MSEKKNETTNHVPLDIRPGIAADEAWRKAQPKSTVYDMNPEATSAWLKSYPSSPRRSRTR